MNNLLITGDSKTNISALKNTLSDYFKILDLGAYYFYLGIKIIYDRPYRTLRLSQEAYFYKILLDHGMENYYGVKTFIETSSRLIPAEPSYKTDPVFRRGRVY
jgi:hypothetical protein